MRHELTGEQFGHLFVTGRRGFRWLCLCDCGKEKLVWTGHLRAGNVTKCAANCPAPYNRIIGERYGRLTVQSVTVSREAVALCVCECGRSKSVRVRSLQSGQTKSCGCLFKEAIKIVGQSRRTHGRKKTAEYRIWAGLKSRCYDQQCAQYPRYGGRGIIVCERWVKSFEAFLADMGERPSPAHSIDRRDNDGPYSPENCRWATATQQSRNRSGNRIIEWRGSHRTIAEWSEKLELRRGTLSERLRLGWSVERAFLTPVRPRSA